MIQPGRKHANHPRHKRNQCQATRVNTPLHRHDAKRMSHMLIGNTNHPLCRLLHGQSQWLRHPLHGVPRHGFVQPHLATKKGIATQASEYQIGVSHGGPISALGITGGSRHGTG